MPVTPEQLTIIGLLLGIGAAGLAQKWVWGWVYQEVKKALVEMTEDRNFWRDIALQSMGHTGKAIEAVAQQKNVP